MAHSSEISDTKQRWETIMIIYLDQHTLSFLDQGMSRGPDLHLGQAYGHKKTH